MELCKDTYELEEESLVASEDINQVANQFEDVFHMLTTLPLFRGKNRAITLKDNVSPIRV